MADGIGYWRRLERPDDPPEHEPQPAPSMRMMLNDPWARVALVSILVGAGVRLLWGLLIHPPVKFVYSDMQGYVERAQQLASGVPLDRLDAFFPPGTQILLAGPMYVFGNDGGLWAGAWLWWVLSSLIPLFAWRLALQHLSSGAAALCAAACAFWPLYTTYGGYFTSETPSLAFMLAGLWAGYASGKAEGRKALALGLLSGVLCGAAIACRPQWILNFLVLVVPMALLFRRRPSALAGVVLGAGLLMGATVAHNSAAADKLTGFSENSALNFWIGHCDVRSVTTSNSDASISFGSPVWAQLERGGTYNFQGPMVWDQGFFYGLGADCIRRDGLGHGRILVRNVLDMTATTVPWPQVGNQAGERAVVEGSNLALSLLLPWIVIESIFLVRRRWTAGLAPGELVMLLHLSCVVVVAVVFFGDPRLRSSYDVFAFALLAALIVDRFGLQKRFKGRFRKAPVAPLDKPSPPPTDA